MLSAAQEFNYVRVCVLFLFSCVLFRVCESKCLIASFANVCCFYSFFFYIYSNSPIICCASSLSLKTPFKQSKQKSINTKKFQILLNNIMMIIMIIINLQLHVYLYNFYCSILYLYYGYIK